VSDPHERGDGISVTLKQDGKDGTWLVFHGSAARVREQIIEVFPGIDETGDAPLFDLINEATRLYKAAGNINSTLGGRVVGSKGKSESNGATGSAWDRAAGNTADAEPEVDPNVARIEAAIEEATDVASLKELYARNKVHFENHPDLLTAYKTKGKALSSK
jgi:hypothetical protein